MHQPVPFSRAGDTPNHYLFLIRVVMHILPPPPAQGKGTKRATRGWDTAGWGGKRTRKLTERWSIAGNDDAVAELGLARDLKGQGCEQPRAAVRRHAAAQPPPPGLSSGLQSRPPKVWDAKRFFPGEVR